MTILIAAFFALPCEPESGEHHTQCKTHLSLKDRGNPNCVAKHEYNYGRDWRPYTSVAK